MAFIALNFYTKRAWKCDKKLVYDKTPYVWSNKFTPAKKILHNCWLWWLRHLEGLLTGRRHLSKTLWSYGAAKDHDSAMKDRNLSNVLGHVLSN